MLPCGDIAYALPFHMSLEGHETAVLCRDDEDYDVMVKVICTCAWRKNVRVIIYVVVANHCHVAILARSQREADEFAQEVKRVYAMWFSHKYGENNILRKIDVQAVCLENTWHLRNALAYIPRNALDNGCDVQNYKWSGFKAMFSRSGLDGFVRVSDLKKKQREQILHARDYFRNTPWRIDADGCLVPESICESWYLEQVFDNDQAFFLKTVGGQDSAQMKYELVDKPRKMQRDTDLYNNLNDLSHRWFGPDLTKLPLDKKIRMVTYASRTNKTNAAQLARVISLPRDMVDAILSKGTSRF